MNATNTIAAETKTIHGGEWMNVDQCVAMAKELAVKHSLPAFVYQTGADRFNFRFISECPELGVLVARINIYGKSV